MTESIRVNVDYEAELFHGKGASPIINQSMEFIGFFLDERPLYTSKKYSSIYLEYVEFITGRRPRTTLDMNYLNWWGELKDIKKEKWLNSKVTSAKLIQDNKWCDHTYIVHSMEDVALIPLDRKYLVKNPFGMSGQHFQILSPDQDEKKNVIWFQRAFEKGPVIIEPLLDRQEDFSHYVFYDGRVICYENVVDRKFQYKGTIFNNYLNPSIESLSLYSKVSETEWSKFRKAFLEIQAFYRQDPNFGYSIDSFIYKENSELKIRFLSEVNYRRTMGRSAYELALRFGQNKPWTMLSMAKSFHSYGGFNFLRERLKDEKDVIILSPGDVRFELFFLRAESKQKGQELLDRLNRLLPDGQFAIKL